MLAKMYERYGGFCQTRPLTVDEQKYDDTCHQLDALQEEIGGISAALFTAAELLWFNWFMNKMFLAPKQEQLDHQLAELQSLRDRLVARKT